MAATARHRPYLVADSRERFVHPFLRNAGVTCVQRQIQVGDYLVCRAPNTGAEPDILAAFERKTWKDFAASILDGRIANLDKMLELRALTGCKLFYILEGPAFPAPSTRFHRVPFARIQAVVTELVVIHGVFVVQTLDQRHTAARLCDFVETFRRAAEKAGPSALPSLVPPEAEAVFPSGPGGTEGGTLSAAEATAATDGGLTGLVPRPRGPDRLAIEGMAAETPRVIPALATKKHEKSTADAAVEAWSRLRGVSLVLGKLLSEKFSFAAFVRGGVTAAELDRIKTAGGKALGRSARASLDRLRCGMKEEALRVLAGVPGVGPTTAAALLDACGGSFSRLLSYGVDALGIITCGTGPKGPKKFGGAKAARLHAVLHFSGVPVASVGASLPSAPAKVREAPALPPVAQTEPQKTEDPPDSVCPLDAELFFELLGLG